MGRLFGRKPRRRLCNCACGGSGMCGPSCAACDCDGCAAPPPDPWASSSNDGGAWFNRSDIEASWPGDCNPPPPPSALCTRVSLSEMVRSVRPQVDASHGCPAVGERCTVALHGGVNDGLGAQMTRRLGLFVTALQLGCGYVYTPLFSMNAKSAMHAVLPLDGDRYFGLGGGCGRPSGRARAADAAMGPCKLPGMVGSSEPRWTARLLDESAATPASAHALLAERVRAWGSAHSHDRMGCEFVVAESKYGVPAALDRCEYLKALATLRARYEQARGLPIPLPWFEPTEGHASSAPRRLLGSRGRGGGGGSGLLTVNVAVHIRRGDNPRIESDESYTRIFANLGSMLAELGGEWARLGRPRLKPVVHIMSEGDQRDVTRAFPLAASWQRQLAKDGCELRWHLSAPNNSTEATNVFRTLDHLIASDVLVAAISGLSNAAMFYHTGVRLVICCVAYGLDPNWWLPGIKTFHLPEQARMRSEAMCRINGHLEDKLRVAQSNGR